MSNVPEGATHYSEAVTDVYFAAYWKEGPTGCWVFALDDRVTPEWIFFGGRQISSRAKKLKQITADEDLQKAIAVMLKDSIGEDGSAIQDAVARRLYKAGYRKVQP